MNHERFMVPEVLFYPSDLGISQAGIAELIVQSIESTPEGEFTYKVYIEYSYLCSITSIILCKYCSDWW
jgi:actin-related protein